MKCTKQMKKKFEFSNTGRLFPDKISKKCFHDFRNIYVKNKKFLNKKDEKEFHRLINDMTDNKANDCYEFLVKRTGNKIQLIDFCD